MADIFDTLMNDGRFATLVTAIERASLMQGLMEPASVTIFIIHVIDTVLIPESLDQMLVVQ